MTLKNFHLAIAISMAIQSPSIKRCVRGTLIDLIKVSFFKFRLQETWSHVDLNIVSRSQKLSDLFSPSKNFSEYRKAMKSVTSPAVGMIV